MSYSDPRHKVASYWFEREAGEDDYEVPTPPGPPAAVGQMESRGTWVEIIVDQAVRRGDFDDLPLAGQPLPDLDFRDPDWWLKGMVRRDGLTGEGVVPEALLLRAEDERLGDRLDAMRHEQQVRTTLTEFNRRIVEARRQLAGGPPVVTPLRDIEAEVAAWHQRRADRGLTQVPTQRPGWLARLLGR
ncbi:MAG: DUF1992 domain-containing protein [Cellulomonas sp.]|jgi:hypothetical protein|nr:DUF1992 domain-containing protein [Cellulomonas sp.]